MSARIVVTGTDTGIGKTVFAAALAGALDATYWKPVQSGLEDETDSGAVQRLSGLAADRILPERYRLRTPASPHLAAEIDGVDIDVAALELPSVSRPLVVEGAGGLMVPLTRETTYIDVFARWAAPLVLCARTSLGTINHTLLSIEAIRARDIPLLGVAFLGDENLDSEQIIVELGHTRRLGRLPRLERLDAAALRAAFAAAFEPRDFLGDAP
ncbi:dethiobiotin synthase [Rhodopseudomonas palustris TIE-1]|uniref:ATP-dependent dethiobiotin synthetase BioD n=1 Tax=Rhodopseudomonas palustris (strain TIE-1) TaxID=395960 RepID=BIOD_RHOPT|nr:dethiobiotin synthase [Rhodopseudomonas palustris]B3Q7Q5.1 RecName: Full=ATP-dependent dethiobiotin synthetase BioD; AltName: Full=DTB synthetase; Short=DTBS; AltName: Full=Dethiobiotin synthase [Rhodopseudomonas palustris TIE-1]ACF01821.1 dethiobiotin synthase [Rhodopseudomonas palustris TIE-1]